MHRVTIIGAGFAGLTAIKQLPATPAAFPDRTGCRSRHTWQAAAAARNLVGEFNGTQMDAGFKVELICIVDSNEKGIRYHVPRKITSCSRPASCYTG